MKKIIISAITILAIGSTNVNATLTANEYMNSNANDKAMYLLGVADGLIAMGANCMPATTPYRQFIAIADKYIMANPERWGESTAQLIMESMIKAFNCSASNTEQESVNKNEAKW
jgi:hypothetical protein